MPKKVAMSQERRDWGEVTGGALIMEQPNVTEKGS